MQLESKIKGIPCIVHVTSWNYTKPDINSDMSTIDHDGGYEIYFDILDRKGYTANWLEKKMTQADEERIEQEIIDYLENRKVY